MDPFGIGARARCKALEEALEVERTRNADLTKQVIALSDIRAYQTIHPRPRPDLIAKERPGITRPTERPNVEAVVAAVRDHLREQKPS